MTHLDDAALDELARLAGEATPGGWTWGRDPSHYDAPEIVIGHNSYYIGRAQDAAYLAAANPATVAALVAEVRRLRAAMPDDWAARVVGSIIGDLRGRRGLRQEWEAIDDDIQVEIREAWIATARAALDGGQ